MESVLPPPPPFNFANNLENITSGNLSVEWKKWTSAYHIYSDACELGKKSDNVQISILLHIIGEQCREVYRQFKSEITTVKGLLENFDAVFLPKKNITIERHKFFTRNQRQSESIEQYSFELKKMADTCEFTTLSDGLIRDRLICGIRDDALRERLLREPDLTLSKAVEICNLAQLSKLQAGTIKKECMEHHAYVVNKEHDNVDEQYRDVDSECGNQVFWMSRRGFPMRRGSARGRGRGRRPLTPVPTRNQRVVSTPQAQARPVPAYQHKQQQGHYSKSGSIVWCSRCGLQHNNNVTCPAVGRKCLKCDQFDHFSRMCRVYEVQTDGSPDQVVHYFSESRSDWSINLLINGCDIKFKLDTGADVNVLPRHCLLDIGIAEHELSAASVKLKAYAGNDIKVIGRCNLKVGYKERDYILDFIIADVLSPPILGRESCCELNVVQLVLSLSKGQEGNLTNSIYHSYSVVFEGVGCMPGEYKIEVNKSIRPVVHAPRKLPIALKDDIKNKLNEMVRDCIIEKVEGPTDWVNSMTVARKANGDIRICLDPRDLNQAIKREHFKLPSLDEMTVNLGDAKYFSTLDAKQGFWQLRLHKDSTHLTTFNTSFGRYKFLRLPFGITSASEVFHKRMFEHFDDLMGVCLFVDDLLVYGRSKQEHDYRLMKVLERCREINLKLNINKCKFGLNEIKYLGHIITPNGIYPDGSYTSAIRNMPRPQNVKDLERFLGMINYVGNFIPNLSDRNHILRELLRKDIEWHWSQEHEKSFNGLKKCLVNVPILQYYSLNKAVVISVDACKNGLGACLLQNNLPVCYASRSLTKAEQNYAQIEKELLACVYACEKFYTYIYGRNDVTIETDHKPLVSIICKPIATAPTRLQRMLLRLQPYCFKLVYKPGKYLYLADTLSRAVEPVPAAASAPRDQLDERAQVCAVALSNPLVDSHFVAIQKLTQEDPELIMLKKYIQNGWPQHKFQVPHDIRSYWAYRNELTVAYDMLWKGDRIIIPGKMRKEMLRRVHIGHLGLEKCKMRLRETMFWPNVTTQLEDFINNCQACLTFKNQNRKETLICHDVPDRAWSKIGVDVFHFNEYKYLIVVDYYSKFLEVVQLKSLTSSHIIMQLKSIFSRQGIPDVVMSDNGPEFSSYEFKDFSREWCFEHITSSPHYAQSNGQVERSVQIVKNMLKKTGVEKVDFRLALLEYLNTPVSNSIASPSELLNNRKLRGIVPCVPKLFKPKIQKHVKRELLIRQEKQKKYYDKNVRDLTTLHPGQKVKVRIDGRWVNGTISSLKGIRSYKVRMDHGGMLIRNRRHLICDSDQRSEHLSNYTTRDLLYDDIVVPCEHRVTSPVAARSPPRAQCRFDSRAAPVPNPSHITANNYITRSGRVVIPPDRWGYS